MFVGTCKSVFNVRVYMYRAFAGKTVRFVYTDVMVFTYSHTTLRPLKRTSVMLHEALGYILLLQLQYKEILTSVRNVTG